MECQSCHFAILLAYSASRKSTQEGRLYNRVIAAAELQTIYSKIIKKKVVEGRELNLESSMKTLGWETDEVNHLNMKV